MGAEIYLIILIISLGAYFIIRAQKKDNIGSFIEEMKAYSEEFSKENDISISYSTELINFDEEKTKYGIYIKYIVDTKKENIVFIISSINTEKEYKRNDTTNYIIPFKEIIGIKIYKNDAVVGGIQRAIIGDIIAGGVGAIVGASTAQSHITS